MKRAIVLLLIRSALVPLAAGCAGAGLSPSGERALTGGAVGAAAGAALGALVGDSAAVGAAIGGTTGLAAGALWKDIQQAL